MFPKSLSTRRRGWLLATLAGAALAGCSPRANTIPKTGPTPAVVAATTGYAFGTMLQRRPAPADSGGVDAAETAAAAHPDDPAAQKRLGLAYYASGGYRAAANALEKVTAAKADDGQAWLYLGYARMGVGEPERAIEALEKAAASNLPPRQRAAARAEVGTVYYQALRQDDKAVPAFREALKLDPTEGTAALALGTLAAQKKDPEARKLFETAAKSLSAGADRASVYACLGRLAEEAKDRAAARDYYKKAVADDKDNAWAKMRLLSYKG